MNKTKKVYKYGTGQIVPEGAVYMTSFVEEIMNTRYVWHYFLVEVEE